MRLPCPPTLNVQLLGLASLLTVLSHGAYAQTYQTPTPGRQYIPGQYIVEYDTDAIQTDSFNSDDSIGQIVDHLNSNGLPHVQINQLQKYDSDVLKGVALQASIKPDALATRDAASSVELSRDLNQEVMQALEKVAKVKAVHQDYYVRLQRDAIKRERAFATPSGEQFDPRDPTSSFEPRAEGDKPTTSIDFEKFAPHVQTGVDIQHKRGNYGEGVTVCVIDTGIDYSHPSFNGGKPAGTPCLGEGCQVVGGIDFVGPDYDGVHRHPGPPRYKDLNTNPRCFHGTHVAGIIGAQATQYTELNFTGVAPKVKFRDYQCYPCSQVAYNSSTDGTTTAFSQVLSAINDGYSAGCDIIHGSFAGDGGWDSFDSGMTSRYAAKGLLCVFSMANGGGYGLWTGGSPAEGQDVIAVGSTTANDQITLPLLIEPPLPDGTKQLGLWTEIAWSSLTKDLKPLKVWFSQAGIDKPGLINDLCDPITGKDAPNLEGYVAFVFRTQLPGGCPFLQQLGNLKALKATATIAINDDREPNYRNGNDGDPLTGMVSREEGLKVLEAYKKNKEITATFSPKGAFDLTFSPNIVPENISAFSSLGPDYYGRVKPDLMGVGEGYFSTLPYPVSYGIFSGTSMSAPLVSGAAALYKSAKGKKVTPKDIQRAFVQTARPLPYDPRTAGSPLLPVFMQGAGQINVTAAIDSQTALNPQILNILDSARGKLTQKITVSNDGPDFTVSQTYSFSHLPAQSLYALQPGAPNTREDTTYTMIPPVPPKADAQATVEFNPSTLKLVGGESADVTVTFKPPPDDPRLLLYSGYLQVTPDQGPGGPVRMPYGGIAGTFASIPAIVSGWMAGVNTNLPALYDSFLYSQIRDDKTAFPLVDKGENTAGYPVLVYLLNTGSERVTCDLVKADVEYTPTLAIIDDDNCCQNSLGEGRGTGQPKSKETVQPKPEVLPDAKRLYTDTPIFGSIRNDTLMERDKANVTWAGYQLCSIDESNKVVDPKTGALVEIPEGEYRFLLRAHRWNAGNGDLTYENTYSSYLSHAFKYDKKAKGIPVPPKPAGQGGDVRGGKQSGGPTKREIASGGGGNHAVPDGGT